SRPQPQSTVTLFSCSRSIHSAASLQPLLEGETWRSFRRRVRVSAILAPRSFMPLSSDAVDLQPLLQQRDLPQFRSAERRQAVVRRPQQGVDIWPLEEAAFPRSL